MRFSDYTYSWLYGENGYYSEYKQIGKNGDFFTSVSTSMLFGGAIAKKIINTINKNQLPKNTTILEIGAHHGYLLADIIQFIYTLEPKLLDTLNFAIVERFEHLKISQKKYFQESFGDKIKLKHYDDIKNVYLENAFVLSNEIFDAFACELIYTKDNIRQMALIKDNKVEFVPCDDNYLNKICDKYKITKGEIAIGYEEFISTITTQIKKFEFLAFDYGDKYPRNDFSLRIYKKHNVYPFFDEEVNLEKLYQNSDITYDVNFNHIIDIFTDNEIFDIEYKTQASSLIEYGIIDLLEIIKKNCDETTYLKEAQKVKKLIEPTGMGDRFKVIDVKKFNV